MNNMQEKQLELVKDNCGLLMKYFDTVQILCTKYIRQGTVNVNYGDGDWFARYGQILKWMESEDQRENTDFPSYENIEDEDAMKKDSNLLKKHVSLLAETFDTVQIFVTRNTDGGMYYMDHGTGNYFARYGHINKWLSVEESNFDETED